MREKNKIQPETDIAFAAATFLLNLLILLILVAVVWSAYQLTAQPDSLGEFFRNSLMF